MKKLNLKRVAYLALVIILVVSLAACGGNNNQNQDNNNQNNSSQNNNADNNNDSNTNNDSDDNSSSNNDTNSNNDTADIDVSEFVTISHLSLGNEPTSGQYEVVKEEWDKYLMDQGLNCELEIQYIGWTDYITKYNLLLATGEDLDMVNTASDWLEMWPNAQKGSFLEIQDLLPKYAPITWETIPESSWAEVTYEGDIIAIPEDMYSQWINHGFMYRGDWADEIGIDEPIDSWDEYGEYLQGVKDLYGDEGVIPFDVAGSSNINALYDGWIQTQTKYICIDPVPSGLAYAKSDEEWDQVVSRFAVADDGTDVFLNYAETMKEWGDNGYWREDVLNNTVDTWTQFKAGLTGTRQHHTQTFIYAHGELEDEIPGADLRFFAWGEENDNLVKMSITHGATAIATNSENPERALMVYDLIRNDEEMYKMFNWGIEGVQYEITDDGMRKQPDDYNIDSDAFASNFWGGRMDKFELKYPNAEMIDNWEEIYENFESYAVDYRYGRFVFDRSPVEAEIAACADVISGLLPAISTGKAGDPQAAVDNFREQMELAGHEKILEETQAQLTAFAEGLE